MLTKKEKNQFGEKNEKQKSDNMDFNYNHYFTN